MKRLTTWYYFCGSKNSLTFRRMFKTISQNEYQYIGLKMNRFNRKLLFGFNINRKFEFLQIDIPNAESITHSYIYEATQGISWHNLLLEAVNKDYNEIEAIADVTVDTINFSTDNGICWILLEKIK